MNNKIVISREPVTLVGAGAAEIPDLQEAAALAPRLFAADGGAGLIRRAGMTPEKVVGDLDSLDPDLRAQLAPDSLWHVAEQETTDFQKLLMRLRAPLALGVGFMGARVDHELAAFHALLRHPETPCVLLGARDIVFHCPPRCTMPLAAESRVSLFPLRRVTAQSRGLKWPTDGLVLEPGGMIGTSNASLGGAVQIMPDGPGLLVILPRAVLAPVTQALLRAGPERWAAGSCADQPPDPLLAPDQG